jgi:hypothetical protein
MGEERLAQANYMDEQVAAEGAPVMCLDMQFPRRSCVTSCTIRSRGTSTTAGSASAGWGRKAVLNDLSPAATFIAYKYNTPVDAAAFERETRRILDEVEAELG